MQPSPPITVVVPESSRRMGRGLLKLVYIQCVVLLSITLACRWFSRSDDAAASLIEQGRADYSAHRYGDAERKFRKAIKDYPQNPEAHYWLGLALRDGGKRDEAMGEFYRAHQLRNDYSDSLVLLAQLMVRSNDVQNIRWSADMANRVLLKKTDLAMRAEAYYILGLGQLRFDNPQGAVDYFNRALRENPNHVGALCLLALLDAENGNVDGGEQRLKAAVARDPGSPVLTSALAEYCRMAKKPVEAERLWRRVLVLDPTNVPARVNLVDLLCSLGRENESEELARSLSNQTDSRYWQWHALLLYRRGRIDDAIAELKQISDRNTGDNFAGLRLAAALVSVNRTKEALGALRSADDKAGRTVGDILMRAQIALNQNDAHKAAELVSEAAAFDPASGQPSFFAARLPESIANPYRMNYELGESLRLESSLLPARLALARRQLAERDIANALGVLESCPRNQCQSYPLLLQRSWLLLAKGDWTEAEAHIAGLSALEKSPEIQAQQVVLQAEMRKPGSGLTAGAEMLRVAQSTEYEGLLRLVGARASSPEEVRAVAIDLGSRPAWESFHQELMDLPRGLMRTTLDPEGLLPLRKFGTWEPMIDAS